jgi:hypothetical protein
MTARFKFALILGGVTLALSRGAAAAVSTDTSTQPSPVQSTGAAETSAPIILNSSHQVRGIHLTASAAGSKKFRQNRLEKIFKETMVNSVVIDIKEEDGHVYVPGVKMAERAGAYVREIPDLEQWIAELKQHNIYTVARVVVFKDKIMPKHNPDLGVHNLQGELWFDRKHIPWLDPYNKEAWKYLHLIALRCSQIGFDEVQFDYIRFPTDGALSQMRFKRPYSREAASQALVDFLRESSQLLHPFGTKVSIDVFGLTTSVNTGMGIGQILGPMAAQVDYVCPMTYPSHYNKGEYNIPNPNDQPYKTIFLAMRDAKRALGPDAAKLRPYLQDFSLPGRGIRYGPKEVRAQIQAAADQGIMDWTLWNARCSYTLSALETPVQPAPKSYQVGVSTH